jgi:tetratricopeptide (TPR) repeat protein
VLTTQKFCGECGASIQVEPRPGPRFNDAPAPTHAPSGRKRRWFIPVIVAGIALVILGAFAWQQVQTEQNLARQYDAAVASASRQEWDRAVTDFEALQRSRSGYRDVATRLEAARKEQRLKQQYDAAMERYRASAWPDAVSQLEKLLAEAPNYRDVGARLADGRRQLGLQRQYEEAKRKLANKELEAAITALEAVAATDSTFSAQARTDVAQAKKQYAVALVAQATSASARFSSNEAERIARAALALDPFVPGGHRVLGDALIDQARYADAREVLQQALRVDSKDAQALNLLGWSHLKEARPDLAQAEQAFRQAIALDPKYANTFAGLGAVFRQLGNPPEARSFYDQALALDSKHAPALQGLAFLALSADDLTTAAQKLQEAIQADSKEFQYRIDLAGVLIRNKQYDQASAEIEAARSIAKDDPDIDAMQARLHREKKEYDKALPLYDSAIKKRDYIGSYQLGKGYTLYFMQRLDEAIGAADRAIELDQVESGNVLRSYALEALRRFPEARQAARAALDANPNSKAAQEQLKALSGR